MTVQRAKKKTNNRAVSAWSRLRDLRDNEDGAVLIYVTMISVVMLGMGVLAIDAARLFDLNTQLQNAADAAALAAASKLAGTAGSRAAARAGCAGARGAGRVGGRGHQVGGRVRWGQRGARSVRRGAWGAPRRGGWRRHGRTEVGCGWV